MSLIYHQSFFPNDMDVDVPCKPQPESLDEGYDLHKSLFKPLSSFMTPPSSRCSSPSPFGLTFELFDEQQQQQQQQQSMVVPELPEISSTLKPFMEPEEELLDLGDFGLFPQSFSPSPFDDFSMVLNCAPTPPPESFSAPSPESHVVPTYVEPVEFSDVLRDVIAVNDEVDINDYGVPMVPELFTPVAFQPVPQQQQQHELEVPEFTASGRPKRVKRKTQLQRTVSDDEEYVPSSPAKKARKSKPKKSSSTNASRKHLSKRDLHNISERERRAGLKAGFEGLRKSVPMMADNPRVHAGTILTNAADYIKQLKREDAEFEAAKAALLAENARLRASLGL